jgi:hypothetical protein
MLGQVYVDGNFGSADVGLVQLPTPNGSYDLSGSDTSPPTATGTEIFRTNPLPARHDLTCRLHHMLTKMNVAAVRPYYLPSQIERVIANTAMRPDALTANRALQPPRNGYSSTLIDGQTMLPYVSPMCYSQRILKQHQEVSHSIFTQVSLLL